MSDNSGAYQLFSLARPVQQNVGIWYLNRDQAGQPVRLDVDLVKWVATPPIGGGGPTRLGVGPYKYTRELEGEALATNQPEMSEEWFLIPSNDEDTYLIAVDPEGKYVWTAGEPRAPIRINPFTGEPNQLFKFVPVLGE